MSNIDLLIVDSGSLINLFRSGGIQALNLLAKQGSKVVIPSEVLEELGRGTDGTLQAVEAFLDAHKADGLAAEIEYDIAQDVPGVTVTPHLII
jgi:hypothetical protein